MFAWLLLDVVLGGPLSALDVRVLEHTSSPRDDLPTAAAELLAGAGAWPLQSAALLAVAMLAAWSWRRVTPVLLALLTLGTLGAVTQTVKLLSGRPAPRIAAHPIDEVTGTAFPSGHAAGALVVGLLATLLLARLLDPDPRPWRLLCWLALGMCWPLAMGWSRLRLRVHWLTDVLGGWALGLAVLALVLGLHALASGGTAGAGLKRTGLKRNRGTVDQPVTAPH